MWVRGVERGSTRTRTVDPTRSPVGPIPDTRGTEAGAGQRPGQGRRPQAGWGCLRPKGSDGLAMRFKPEHEWGPVCHFASSVLCRNYEGQMKVRLRHLLTGGSSWFWR